MKPIPHSARIAVDRLTPQKTVTDERPDYPLLRALGPQTGAAVRVDQREAQPFPDRILVVDDDEGVRGILAKVLSGAGYLVRCAEDGEAGWDVLGAENFDVLITDYDMPRLTGLDLLRRMRAAALCLPVILISGRMLDDEPDLPRLLRPGLMLEKPFSFVTLLESILSILPPAPPAGPSGGGPTRQGFERATVAGRRVAG
jgi:DNA-binding response OmpR family regulator